MKYPDWVNNKVAFLEKVNEQQRHALELFGSKLDLKDMEIADLHRNLKALSKVVAEEDAKPKIPAPINECGCAFDEFKAGPWHPDSNGWSCLACNGFIAHERMTRDKDEV